MKKEKLSLVVLTAVLLACSALVSAQVRRGDVIIPESSIARPADAGLRVRTNYMIYAPPGVQPSSPNPTGETPASLGCVYGVVSNPIPGCPISGTTENPSGGDGVIAIVDAFHYPTAQADMDTFTRTFHLPRVKVHVVTPPGTAQDCGWNIEAALDIQWAHAMAPRAKIVLVEAKTNSFADMNAAVDRANAIITAHGGKGQVSMSWGASEFAGETSMDSHFLAPGIVYFAASGDVGGVTIWPGTSPNVVSAGGTTILRSGGNFTGERAWSGSGGGPSLFEARPSFQDAIQNIVGTKRGAPDFSFDADPASGVSVFVTSPACGNLQWLQVGGTSVSSPALAGIVNSAGLFNTSSNAENTLIYSNLGNSQVFTDITTGQAGSHQAGPGWDFVTGVGTNKGLTGK